MRRARHAAPRGQCTVVVALLFTVGCEGSPSPEWMEASVPTPTVFAPGVISTPEREYGVSFSPDGRESYFTRRPGRGSAQIFVSRFADGAWSEPVLISFAGEHDEAPHLSGDGRRMIFASRRPLPATGDRSENLWVSERGVEGDWGSPEPLRGVINHPREEGDRRGLTGTELGPVWLADGSILYWSNVDPAWGADIYRAVRLEDGSYGGAVPLLLNSMGDETNVAVTPDGSHLLFQAYRDASAFGGQDLYVARRNDFGWGRPVLLPEPFNSEANDGYPSFSPDGRYFFFATDRDARGGYYDIWYVETEALDLDQLTRLP